MRTFLSEEEFKFHNQTVFEFSVPLMGISRIPGPNRPLLPLPGSWLSRSCGLKPRDSPIDSGPVNIQHRGHLIGRFSGLSELDNQVSPGLHDMKVELFVLLSVSRGNDDSKSVQQSIALYVIAAQGSVENFVATSWADPVKQ